MIKKLMLLFLLAAAILPTEAVVVAIRQTDGTSKDYAVSEVSGVKFTANGPVVLSLLSGQSVELTSNEFAALEFDNQTSIKELLGGDKKSRWFVIEGNCIAAYDGSRIALYSLAGEEIAHSEAGRIDISGLEKGIYIVTSNNNSEKIIVR